LKNAFLPALSLKKEFFECICEIFVKQKMFSEPFRYRHKKTGTDLIRTGHIAATPI
jgi:hypothetical protein